VKRAFSNLIDNAAKYGKNPEIELSCEETAFVVGIYPLSRYIPSKEMGYPPVRVGINIEANIERAVGQAAKEDAP
jgi:signal transduction histidine kinase